MLNPIFHQQLYQFFDGENYQLWVVRMKKYLEDSDLQEAVEENYEIPPLLDNPTMAQVKRNKEKRAKKSKAKAGLFVDVSTTFFTKIMSLKTAKDIQDYLKKLTVLEMKGLEAYKC